MKFCIRAEWLGNICAETLWAEGAGHAGPQRSCQAAGVQTCGCHKSQRKKGGPTEARWGVSYMAFRSRKATWEM